MNTIRKLCVASAAVVMVAAGQSFAQDVETPYSPLETGLADHPWSEAFSGPAAPAQGGTMAPETGRTVRIEGGSADSLPMTPDSDPEYNRNGD